MENILHANDDNFDEILLKNPTKRILLDFHASWCGPCKAMAPALDAFARENPDVLVVKVDVDSAPATGATYLVRSVPTLVVVRDGEVLAARVGSATHAQLKYLLETAE